MYPLKQSTALDILIFAADSSGNPVTGKVNGDWTKKISKAAGAFAAMTVTITEREGGWYLLPLSAAHTDTLGVLSAYFTAAGVKQINVQFRVHSELTDDLQTATSGDGSVSWSITINDSNSIPVADVDVVIRASSDPTAAVVASGQTNASGVVVPTPQLDPGTYYVWRQKAGMNFTNPATITVA